MELDERDAALLAALQADARQTNRRLAERLGIAPSTCLERVRALQARGVITGFHATVSLPAIGRGLQALLSVQVRPMSREVITGFKQFAIALPEVIAVMVVTGSDDFLVHVAVPDVASLHAFLMDKFTGRREIVGFRSQVIYEHTAKPAVIPL